MRFSWRVSLERAPKAEVILATVRGIVRGVYVTDEWLKSSRENFPEMSSWNTDDEFEATQSSRYGFRVGKHLLALIQGFSSWHL